MFCRSCGKKIPDHSEKCPICGASQSITEREYRTGSRSRAGAFLVWFRKEPAARQAAMILEWIGILLGLGGILFAAFYPDAALTVGDRAVLAVVSGAVMLGFGITFCVSLGSREV